jgi:NhaP-type Na+/H+ or K+/H+ antiporter
MLIAGVFFAGLLVYGLFSRRLDRLSISPQMALLALGMVVGWVGATSTEMEGEEELLELVGEVALILCLYVDAARINVGALRGTAILPVRLLAVGLPLTIVVGIAAAALTLPGLGMTDIVLLALLVAPTDAALGALVVNSPTVPVRIRQALNVESGLNDGLVTPLVLVVAAFAAAGGTAPEGWVADAVGQIVLGSGAGVAVGGGAAWLVGVARRRDWIHDGARWVIAPSIAVVTWFVAEAIGGNAFVGAFVAGLTTAVVIGTVREDFLEFGEVGGELLGLVVFFLVGALLPIKGPYGPDVVVFAILALTAVRMVPVAVSLVGTHLATPTLLFMGWFGPRGLASVVLALVALGEVHGGGGEIAPVVTSAVLLTIVLSVVLHGLTAGPFVRAYVRAIDRLPATAAEHEEVAVVPTRATAITSIPSAAAPTRADRGSTDAA